MLNIINCTIINSKHTITNLVTTLYLQEYISQKARRSVFPNVPWHIRMKQLWIATWYEPNQILQKYHYYSRDYLRSLDNKFNGTITYRNDSLINSWIYAGGCHYKKNPDFSESVGEDEWQIFSNAAVNRSR